MGRPFVAAVVLLVVAGCTASSPADEPSPGGVAPAKAEREAQPGPNRSMANETPAAPTAEVEAAPRVNATYGYNLARCVFVGATMHIDKENADAVLPEGYHAKEGGHLFGQNPGLNGTGLAVFNFGSFACEEVEGASGLSHFVLTWIDIDPPDIEGESTGSPHPGYDVLNFVQDTAQAEYLRQAGLAVEAAQVVVEVVEAPGAAVGALTITGADGELAYLQIAGGGGWNPALTLGSWHQSQDGASLSNIDQRGTAAFYPGTTLECRVAEGSFLAQIIGATDCTAVSHVSVVATRVVMDGSIKFLAGVRPAVDA